MGNLISACLTSKDMAPLELVIERLINDAVEKAFAKIQNPDLSTSEVKLEAN